MQTMSRNYLFSEFIQNIMKHHAILDSKRSSEEQTTSILKELM